MEVPTNPTRQSAFVWICGSFFISANEIRVSREVFLCTGTETHGGPEMRSANRSDLSCPQHSISKRYGWLKLVLRYLPKMSPLNKVTLFLHFCYTNISQPYISGVRNTFGRKLRKCVRRTVRADLSRRSLHTMLLRIRLG